MYRVTHKSGDYYITKPIWRSKIPFIIEILGLIAIGIIAIERTIN